MYVHVYITKNSNNILTNSTHLYYMFYTFNKQTI